MHPFRLFRSCTTEAFQLKVAQYGRKRKAFNLIVCSFDYYIRMETLITDIVLRLEVPGGLLKQCLQVNTKAKISSIGREKASPQKGFKGQ